MKLVLVHGLADGERELVLLVAPSVAVAHEVERQVVLPDSLRCRELELDARLALELHPLDRQQSIVLGVADEEPPALLLVLRVGGRVHVLRLRVVVALQLHAHRPPPPRLHLVRVHNLVLERHVGVPVAHRRHLSELGLGHLEELHAILVLHVHQVEHRLDAGLGALLGHVRGDVRQLQQVRRRVPQRLDNHLRDLHGGERGFQPP
mmetsp:Transcript_62196/g.148189  ORF Transcript_62196/g.148189 Transcript_62196/m.148189 type:complete len:206 (-) Transcript_62196:6034-6651(-)